MSTIGTSPWQVSIPDLSDDADITEAFTYFYLGGDPGATAIKGIHDHILTLNTRLTAVETAPINSEYSSSVFRIYDNSVTSKKISFNASTLASSTTAQVTVPGTGTMVLNDFASTLKNKTIDATNTIQSDWNNFSLAKMSGGSVQYTLKFDVSSLTGNKTITVPDASDTLALLNTAQTISNKSFAGYKESSTTVSVIGSSNDVAASSFNLVLATPTPTVTGQQMIVNFTGMTDGTTTFIIFRGHSTIAYTPVIRVNGSTTSTDYKWAGGSTPAAITANASLRYTLVSITRLNSINFCTYLGEYY